MIVTWRTLVAGSDSLSRRSLHGRMPRWVPTGAWTSPILYRPDAGGRYESINLFQFYLPLDQTEWRVADFNGLISVASPQKSGPALRKAKRFEMTDEMRRLFGDKFAAFFIR